MEKSKVLIIGGTGYIGKRLVKASLRLGHETHVLKRPEIGLDIDKLQLLMSFKEQGAKLVTASLDDHQSLLNAVKQVDVVVSAIAGVPNRGHYILQQLRLIDAIKEAGNIKFGVDVARMGHVSGPGKETWHDKIEVRKAIEEAKIPFTYISSNGFAGYFLGGLCQFGPIEPYMDSVVLFGDGNVKGIFVDEDDIATYTIKTIDDPRTLNKTVYIRPPQNILSQREVIQIWEKLTNKELQKSSISAQEFLGSMKGQSYEMQGGVIHYYHILFEGCLTNFEIDENGVEACQLYPEIKYTTARQYLKRYL